MYIAFPIISLLLCIYISYKVYLTFTKQAKPETFGLILGVLHFILVITTIIQLNQNPIQLENAETWLIFCIIDFPISLIDILLSNIHLARNIVLTNYIFPLIIYGLFGTIEYYFVGYFLIILHNRKSLKQTKVDPV
jgi:hypothetical protein